MAHDEQLAARVRQFFKARVVAFEEKRMMGGLCFMVDRKMCVGVEKKRLMARIDPSVYERALGRKGCVPMDFTGRPMRGFLFVDGELMGFAVSCGHIAEVGGMVPGAFAGEATEIFHEGLRVPPLKIVKAGKAVTAGRTKAVTVKGARWTKRRRAIHEAR